MFSRLSRVGFDAVEGGCISFKWVELRLLDCSSPICSAARTWPILKIVCDLVLFPFLNNSTRVSTCLTVSPAKVASSSHDSPDCWVIPIVTESVAVVDDDPSPGVWTTGAFPCLVINEFCDRICISNSIIAKTAKRGGGRDGKKGTETFASRLSSYKNCLELSNRRFSE